MTTPAPKPASPCAAFLDRLADHADDLLDPLDAAAVEAHVASCEACAGALARARSLSAAVRTPWDVAGPPDDLATRVRSAAAQRSARRHAVPVSRWVGAALRYGVAFAAGVVVALAVARGRPEPTTGPAVAAPASNPPDVGGPAASDALALSSSPRRLH